jgi:hypothetical protein
MFTAGMVGMAFVSLDTLSPRATQLRKEMEDRVRAQEETYAPGLLEQYKIMLSRLERGAPGCELISFPGFNSPPGPLRRSVCGSVPHAITQTCRSQGRSTLPWALRLTIPSLEALSYAYSLDISVVHFDRILVQHTKSSDPTQEPVFDPRYFKEEIGNSAFGHTHHLLISHPDLQTMVEQVKFVRKLADVDPLKVIRRTHSLPSVPTLTFQRIQSMLDSELFPGVKVTSDEEVAGQCRLPLHSCHADLLFPQISFGRLCARCVRTLRVIEESLMSWSHRIVDLS